MRIEMAVPSLEIGGMETVVVSMMATLSRHGHQVGVTCLNEMGDLSEVLTAQGIQVHLHRAPGWQSNFFAPSLTAHFESIAPDVVHTHSGVWGRAGRAAYLAGVKRIVHTIHGKLDRDPWYDIPLKRWEARHSNSVVAVSPALAMDAQQRIGVDPHKLLVIENGIDLEHFRPDAENRVRVRQALGLDDSFVIGIVARLVPVKNIEALLVAFAALVEELPNCKLLIVGDGPLYSSLMERVDGLGILGAVRFLGFQRDTVDLYRAFDLFVLPSLAEGTSVSILESLATGTSVVATPVGNNGRLLGDGSYGFVTRSTSASDLLQQIRVAATQHTERITRALRGRTFVSAEFSIESMCSRYLDVYRGQPLDRHRLTAASDSP